MGVAPPDAASESMLEILEAVADAENSSVLDLPPLYDVIDPECMERLIHTGPSVTVAFSYCGYWIHVANGQFAIADDECEGRQPLTG